jgi:uncharacterized membrane protein YcaP (DUF421 family)
MLEMGSTAAAIVLRTGAVHLGVFVGLRLMGKRELGQMTVFDLVVILLVANAVQNAMVGPDRSLQGGLIAAGVLLVLNRAVAALRLHAGRWGRLIEGTPTVLAQVRLAVLETDGSISIVPSDAQVVRKRKHVRQIRH